MLALTLLVNFIVFGGLGSLAVGIFSPDRIVDTVRGFRTWIGLSTAENEKRNLSVSNFSKSGEEALPQRQSRMGVTIVVKEGEQTQGSGQASEPGYDPERNFDEAQLDAQFGAGPETPDAETAVSPVAGPGGLLGSDRSRPKINTFDTVTLVEKAADCVKAGRRLVHDIGLAETHLKVVVSSAAITIARICATNGIILLTCRNNRMIISPRRARPDDGCR